MPNSDLRTITEYDKQGKHCSLAVDEATGQLYRVTPSGRKYKCDEEQAKSNVEGIDDAAAALSEYLEGRGGAGEKQKPDTKVDDAPAEDAMPEMRNDEDATDDGADDIDVDADVDVEPHQMEEPLITVDEKPSDDVVDDAHVADASTEFDVPVTDTEAQFSVAYHDVADMPVSDDFQAVTDATDEETFDDAEVDDAFADMVDDVTAGVSDTDDTGKIMVQPKEDVPLVAEHVMSEHVSHAPIVILILLIVAVIVALFLLFVS